VPATDSSFHVCETHTLAPGAPLSGTWAGLASLPPAVTASCSTNCPIATTQASLTFSPEDASATLSVVSLRDQECDVPARFLSLTTIAPAPTGMSAPPGAYLVQIDGVFACMIYSGESSSPNFYFAVLPDGACPSAQTAPACYSPGNWSGNASLAVQTGAWSPSSA
jgi:hypothetical protein